VKTLDAALDARDEVRSKSRSSALLRGTLGARRGWRGRLLLHHFPIAFTSCVGLVVFALIAPSHGGISLSQIVISTGYVATVFLAVTLLIGPANLILRRRNPVSTYLRRDIGVWTGLWSLVHVVLAFQQGAAHGGGIFRFIEFFVVDGKPLTNGFGWGNWTGLGATVIVVALLVTSTDRAMRELSGRRWKMIQRFNYAIFVLVLLHAIFYGALQRMPSPLTLLLIGSCVAVVAGQAVGIRLWRCRKREKEERRQAEGNQRSSVTPNGAPTSGAVMQVRRDEKEGRAHV
jgi:sulfoxide reductase heme-binding subunit YedZ